MSAVPDPSWSIRKFAVWWLRSKPMDVPADGLRFLMGSGDGAYRGMGVTMYRSGPFQVQLFLISPMGGTTNHAHPNIDSVEVHVAGDGWFKSDEESRWFGMVCVAPSEYHEAAAGEQGHAFYSIQKWLNGTQPSSVELDWGGETLDAAHAAQLQGSAP